MQIGVFCCLVNPFTSSVPKWGHLSKTQITLWPFTIFSLSRYFLLEDWYLYQGTPCYSFLCTLIYFAELIIPEISHIFEKRIFFIKIIQNSSKFPLCWYFHSIFIFYQRGMTIANHFKWNSVIIIVLYQHERSKKFFMLFLKKQGVPLKNSIYLKTLWNDF